MKKNLMILTIVLSACIGVYGACFIQGLCKCVNIGQCYGVCIPNNCQTPTCIIADETVTTWNVCSGNGGLKTRTSNGQTWCPVSLCRIYNNCTGQYEVPPCGCGFSVPYFEPGASNCI